MATYYWTPTIRSRSTGNTYTHSMVTWTSALPVKTTFTSSNFSSLNGSANYSYGGVTWRFYSQGNIIDTYATTLRWHYYYYHTYGSIEFTSTGTEWTWSSSANAWYGSHTFDIDSTSTSGAQIDASATYTTPSPTRTGYTLNNWTAHWPSNQGGDTNYSPGASVTHNWTGDYNWEANWTANSYIVTLDQQSGSGGTTSVTSTYDSAMPSGKTAPSRTGYTFGGYYSSIGGNGTKYYNADMTSAHIWDTANNTTLYAYWIINSYTVNFNKGSGTLVGTTPQTVNYNSTISPSNMPSATLTGYSFVGWFDTSASTGGTQLTTSTAITKNWTVYARFTPITYQIKYNANGGSGTMSNQTVTYNNLPFTLTSNAFTNTGYAFIGWGTSAGSTSPTYSNNQSINTNLSSTSGDVINLYALWDKCEAWVMVNQTWKTIKEIKIYHGGWNLISWVKVYVNEWKKGKYVKNG